MFCGKHEETRQIDCKRGKEWTNVHLRCKHAWSEFHVIHTWKRAGDIGIWHKRVGHVNFQHFKLMEKQNLVRVLPKFGIEKVMSEVCEACQLGKQSRHPFPA